MKRYRPHDLPASAEGVPDRVIEYGEVLRGPTVFPGPSERRVSRRDLVRCAAWFAAGAVVLGVAGSTRRSLSPAELTEEQLRQVRAEAEKTVQQEFAAAEAARDQAVQDSNLCNQAMDQRYNLVDVQFLWGTVYTGQRPVCRNPLYLCGPDRLAPTIEQFMQGAYFGTPGPGSSDAPVEIVSSFLQPGQRYVPSDPHATDFVRTVNVRVSSVGIGGYELMAVDGDNEPLTETDGISWMHLCVPLQ